MALSNQQKRELKAKAHNLKPIVAVGSKGLTTGVLEEIDISLKAHELMKVRIGLEEKSDRMAVAEEICIQAKAEFINLIGHIAIIYRPKED